MSELFNNRLRQIILLILVILLGLLLIKELYIFLPGFLGAVTMYIMLRGKYILLTQRKKWNPLLTNILFISGSLLIIALPFYFSIELVSGKISAILSDPSTIIKNATLIAQKVEELTGRTIITDENIKSLQDSVTGLVPILLTNTASLLGNILVMFFLLYYLLKNGGEIEGFLTRIIPLKKKNIVLLSKETKNMIKANAIGIPVLAIIQGIIAMLGYWIFGVNDFVLWGFVTGVFSMLPIIGTAVVWAPLCLYLLSLGESGKALGLLIYSVVIITNIDYIARLTILKKFMDIHPLITVFGVIVGINLFGFWGVIFGPLLFSYIILLSKIYFNEFGVMNANENPD